MITDIRYGSHEEWLAIRGNYIGGSDAGAIVGMNQYKSAYTLWAEKSGMIPEFEGNVNTKVGAYLEEFVAKMFEDETGKKVRRKNATMVNDKYPFACANVDRLVVGEKALLEIKTTNSFPAMRKIRDGEFPEQWYCQVVHYMAVTELEKAYLAVLINCREFKVFELTRDEAEVDALMKAESDFWYRMKNNIAPPVDGTESTSDTISTIFPGSNDAEVNLFGYDQFLKDYIDIGKQIKTLKEMQNEAANKVKAFMGDSGRGVSDGFKVSWTSSDRSTFDAKKYAEDHPNDDLSAYYKVTNVRTFKVTER